VIEIHGRTLILQAILVWRFSDMNASLTLTSENRQTIVRFRVMDNVTSTERIPMTPYHFSIERLETPTGPMLIVTDNENQLRAVDWEDHKPRMLKLLGRHYGVDGFRLNERTQPSAARKALQAYFEGDLNAIVDLPVATFNARPGPRCVGFPAAKPAPMARKPPTLASPKAPVR
jgi:hypothetical protein